jgi:carbamoyl-phosphate synthase small subunit
MELKLVLENGKEFIAQAIGYPLPPSQLISSAELVFNTAMTGYQEIFTDPSYCDQIVTLTYPLIGNYGVNRNQSESLKPQLKGVILKDLYENAENGLNEFLIKNKITGIKNIDTRMLTKIIRDFGTLKAVICHLETSAAEIEQALKQVIPKDQIARVSTKEVLHYPNSGMRIALVDYGFKKGILQELLKRKCDVVIVPYNYTFEQIKALAPQGIVLSNGPGDPASIIEVVKHTIEKLQATYPLFAICMGHQLFAMTNHANSFKLKFGHRGANHAVKDLASGRFYITSQNHGYAIDEKSIDPNLLTVTQINLNDQTIEGLKHTKYPAFSVQYHPEAHPGPEDTSWLFDQFLALVKKENNYAS